MADNSNFTGTARRTEAPSTTGGSIVVRSYDSYAAAQEAVDSLADRGYPVGRLAVVARDLVFVERVTGRRTVWRAARDGARSGAFVGALLGFFFGLFDWIEPLVSAVALALWGLILGTALGGLMGAAGHWTLRGRRDFSSVTGMEAGAYDLMADPETAADVRTLLPRRWTPRRR